MNAPRDTIAAVATPPGVGGVGIVRISGPRSLEIAGRIFRGRGGRPLDDPPLRLRLGAAVDPASGEPIDEVLAVLMPEGRSYTGETTVEVHAHGGRIVLEAVLGAAVAAGARLAAPGEFTRRAFLGGRLDLSQAEAVADLIGAESERERRCALLQLQGGLAAGVRDLRERLLGLVAATEAVLDFADEDGAGEEPAPAAIIALADDLRALAAKGRAARAAHRGARVVIAGPANSGKSSLFNKLLDFERSIVAPTPGTTRDYVEERTVLSGTALTLIDTAGIRSGADQVEAEGVSRSRRLIEDADVVVITIDGSVGLEHADLELVGGLLGRSPLVVVSKDDLPAVADRPAVRRLAGDPAVFALSALTGSGVREFAGALAGRCRAAAPADLEPAVAPNLRHQGALTRAASALDAAGALVAGGLAPLDQVAVEFRSALAAIDEITGETAADEIVESIFSRFCVGK